MSQEPRVAGQPARRIDGIAKVTGAARYAIDLSVPGMAHAIVVRSTRAHARILSIDRAAAERSPGVVRVITGDDLVAAGLSGPAVGAGLEAAMVAMLDGRAPDRDAQLAAALTQLSL